MARPDSRLVQRAYFEALERQADERDAFLANEFASQPELVAEVRSLLDANESLDDFLTRPVLDEFGAALAPAPPPPVLGKYRLGNLLARGGMGSVYLATDEQLHRPVALKIIQGAPGQESDAWRKTEREARLLASLNHPNIATIYSLEEAEGIRFFAMELLEGPTLAERCLEGALPYSETLGIGRRIASALEAAHARGVLHCDLKPGNVQCSGDGEWKVLDFGVGRLRHDESPLNLTRPPALFCTPGYASPEQLAGDYLDERSDLFALGCLLFECFTGQRCFDRGDPTRSTLEDDPPWSQLAADVSPAMDRLLRSLLARKKKERLPSAAAARQALDAELLRGEMRAIELAEAEQLDSHHNLPPTRGRFVGRAETLERVKNALKAAPLVTLTGMPGCGKSRIALEIGRKSVGRYPDGVWFADLARIRNPDNVLGVIGEAIGVRETGDRDLADHIAKRLGGGSALIVLDNCEHVVERCAELLPRWMTSGPGVRFLATSREALEVAGEERVSVEPFSTEGDEAEELFHARLAEARVGGGAADIDRATVRKICRELDGIPLAIELAAARARSLPLPVIEKRLSNRFQLLRSPRRDGGHHRTLDAAIRWSYDLLEPSERNLFRRLSLFRGFSLEAAEAIGADDALAAWDVLDALGRLVEKSLVNIEFRQNKGDERLRYRIVESLRQFAEGELAPDERTAVGNRVGDYYATWCEEASRHIHAPGQVEWIERAAEEESNLHLALATLADSQPGRAMDSFCRMLTFWETRGDTGAASRLGQELLDRLPAEGAERQCAWGFVALGVLAGARGRYDEARDAYEQGRAHAQRCDDRPRICQSETGLANLYRITGDFERARTTYLRVLDLNREIGDARNLAGALGNLGAVEEELGNLKEARALGEESLDLLRALDDSRGVAVQLNNLGVIYRDVGEHDRARTTFLEGLRLREQIADRRGAALAHNNLGALAQSTGRLGEAQEHYERASELSREIGDALGAAGALCNLGMVAMDRGELDDARKSLQEGLRTIAEQGARPWLVEGIEAFARLEFQAQDPTRAATLAAAARALRAELGLRTTADEAIAREDLDRQIQSALDGSGFEAARNAGAGLGFDGAVAYALGSSPLPAPRPRRN